MLKEKLVAWEVKILDSESIGVESVVIKLIEDANEKKLCVTWENQDEDMGRYILSFFSSIF
jgi:hypothetical protein